MLSETDFNLYLSAITATSHEAQIHDKYSLRSLTCNEISATCTKHLFAGYPSNEFSSTDM